MNLSIPIAASVIGAGQQLNRYGKQPRGEVCQRQTIPGSERPSSQNIYQSNRYKETENKVLNTMQDSYAKAYDPYNRNVIGPQFNTIGSFKSAYDRQQETRNQPPLRSLAIRGAKQRQQIGKQVKQQKYMNDGTMTQEQEISYVNQSPMFTQSQTLSPADVKTNYKNQYPGGWDSISDPRGERAAGGRAYEVANHTSMGSGVTKQEHFGNITVSGPQNSNDPMMHNNMTPFVGLRGGNQNMNPDAMQSRLEAFTGQTNNPGELRSQPKREILSLFDQTAGQSYVYGAPADNVSRDLDRYWTSTKKTNVLPTEQERVGPGINYGYGDKSHDGFHTWYQPTMKNVDELRVNPKSVYEGRVKSGAEPVKNRGFTGDVYKRRPDRFYLQGRDRWLKTTGSYVQPTVRENFKAFKTRREDSRAEDYRGIAGSTADNAASYAGIRMQGDCHSACSGNSSSIASEVQHTRRNQFQQADPRSLTAAGEAGLSWDYGVGSHIPYQQQRNTTEFEMGAQRLNAFSNQGSTHQPYDNARTTTRQTTNVRDYNGVAGNVPSNSKPTSYMAGYNATVDDKKESLLPGRAPGPNKTVGPSTGGCGYGDVHIKNRANYDVNVRGMNGDKQYNAVTGVQQNYENASFQGIRDNAGIRQPENFLVEQYNRNPFTKSLASAPKMTPN